MIGIYKITSPTGKIYIGQSVNIEKRFSQYLRLHCKDIKRLYRSFLKHGVDNHVFETIEECSIDLLNTRERYWQEKFNTISKNGLNCFYVQTNEKKYIASEDLKLTRKLNRIGRKHTKETIEKLRKPKTEEHKLKLSISQKKRNPEVIKKQSESLSKNKENNKRLLEYNQKRKIKIGVFDFNTNEKISEFNSIRECAKTMNVDRKSISLSCKNIYPYAYGFKFEYL
jgi:group I intron endonuclease